MKFENLKVMRVGEVRSGIAPATGYEWSYQDLILSWQGVRGETNYICATSESVKSYGLQVGDIITADLIFYTRLLSSGKIANHIQITNIQKN